MASKSMLRAWFCCAPAGPAARYSASPDRTAMDERCGCSGTACLRSEPGDPHRPHEWPDSNRLLTFDRHFGDIGSGCRFGGKRGSRFVAALTIRADLVLEPFVVRRLECRGERIRALPAFECCRIVGRLRPIDEFNVCQLCIHVLLLALLVCLHGYVV